MLNIVQNNQITVHCDGFRQGYYQGERPFYPFIGHNVLEVSVDLSWCSKLQFERPLLTAEKLILWQLDLGLEKAMMPLEDEGQFTAQGRALQEFVQQLFETLRGQTFGISLYKGTLDFDPTGSLLDYLKLLTAYLPEGVPLFLMLEGKRLSDATFLARTNKEHYFPFQLILDHPLLARWPYALDSIGWGFSTVMGAAYSSLSQISTKRLPYAFLLPHSASDPLFWERVMGYGDLIERLQARLIPEVLFTEMWEGVEELYVLKEALTAQGKRKLAGFEAAGGLIHFLS